MASLLDDPKRLWLCTTYSGATAIAMAKDEDEARQYLQNVLASEATDINDVLQPFELLELNISLPFARLIAEPVAVS
jgi:hypothetical protein